MRSVLTFTPSTLPTKRHRKSSSTLKGSHNNIASKEKQLSFDSTTRVRNGVHVNSRKRKYVSDADEDKLAAASMAPIFAAATSLGQTRAVHRSTPLPHSASNVVLHKDWDDTSRSSSSSSGSGDIDIDPEHGSVEERLALRKRLLTSTEAERVEDAIGRNGSSNEIMIKKFKVEMTRKLMRCLSGLTWLNDEAINFCMEMLNARDQQELSKRLAQPHDEKKPPMRRVWCVKSFLITKLEGGGEDVEDVRRWSKKAKLGPVGTSIFDLWRMVVPVNIGNSHWTSVHVDFINQTCVYYDSMGGRGQKYLLLVMKYLKGEHFAKLGKPLDEGKWTISSLGRSIPQQENCSDCGMFTCTFATYATDTRVRGRGDSPRVLGIPLQFSQRDMLYLRNRLALDILNGNID